MKQITLPTGEVFGPFEFVEIQEDRYHTDTTDLPFTVVGDNCVIGEYIEPPPAETPAE